MSLGMQDQKKGQSTGSTGSMTGGSTGIRGRAGEQMSDEAGMRQTSTMLREEQGHAGMQQQGSMGQTERGTEAGEGGTPSRVTRGRGAQESEDAGMDQATRMLREAHEEGDPEMQMREEDLHARQQNLGEREKSLGERDEQLRPHEQGLRERQSRITGRGRGATDYTDDRHIQNRR
ncbi:MAG TPA: hypothetical protein HA263_11475 [Methanoregulaceae archaeon]|nr:hypothetical protein [Methanoregulaceae archaeon]